MLEKWCHFSCNLWSIYFFTWTTARLDSGLNHWRSCRYTTRTWSGKCPRQHITAILKLWNGWSRVVMYKGLLVSMAWNGHMSIRNVGIGPQCYGRHSDAVVCVYSGKTSRFADFFHHVCKGVDAKWPLLEPHVIFRTEICLRILKKSTAILADLFKP